MDLRQLATLVAVADHRTFSAAAKALFTTQSNVSAHIAKLERETGVTLVDRGRGNLTEAGRLIVARARRIQGELDSLRGDLASLGTDAVGETRLGIIPTTARWLLPRLLELLGSRHPRVRMVVTSATTSSLRPQLANGALDAAVLALPLEDPELTVTPLFREELVLLAPKDHPLAARSAVSLAELSGVPLLLEAPGTTLRTEIEQAAARAGSRLTAAAEIDGVRLIASLAIDGHGAAIVPVTTIPAGEHTRARAVPIRDLPPREVGIARPRRVLLSRPAQVTLDTLHDVLRAGVDIAGVELLGTRPSPEP
jgi:DNA-binding transcriptional LysR family regulator